jgi:hypothetical protein
LAELSSQPQRKKRKKNKILRTFNLRKMLFKKLQKRLYFFRYWPNFVAGLAGKLGSRPGNIVRWRAREG